MFMRFPKFTKSQLYCFGLIALLAIILGVHTVYVKTQQTDVIEEQYAGVSDSIERAIPVVVKTEEPATKTKAETKKPAESKTIVRTVSESTQKPQKNRTPNSVNLNTANFDELCKVYYVGEKTANKIIEYRDRLGGYVNVEQIIDALHDAHYDAVAKNIPLDVFYVEEPVPVKNVKIKQLSLVELAQHPYIDNLLARKIARVCEEHKLNSIDDFWMYFNKDEVPEFLVNYLDFSE